MEKKWILMVGKKWMYWISDGAGSSDAEESRSDKTMSTDGRLDDN